jgi:structural maintenance of chromosome 1
LGTEAESTQATTDIYEKEAAIEIDYSPLRDDLKVIERFVFQNESQ